MRRLYLYIFIICIIIITPVVSYAAAMYSWTGDVSVGDKLIINNDLSITIDLDKISNRAGAIVESKNDTIIVYENEEKTLDGYTIQLVKFNDKLILSIQSTNMFTVSFEKDPAVEKLEEENKKLVQENEQLKRQLEELNKQIEALNAQIAELNKQIDELDAKLSNKTQENVELQKQLEELKKENNMLQGKAQYLEEQNKEYRELIQKVMEVESEKNVNEYLDNSKKYLVAVKVLLFALLFTAVIVTAVGLFIYSKYKQHKYPRLRRLGY